MVWSNRNKVRLETSSDIVPQRTTILIEWEYQIRIEISDYTGNKISVGVARPSLIGQSVPHDR